VAHNLVQSLRNATVVRHEDVLEVFDRRPVGAAEAIRQAMRSEERGLAATRWSDAVSADGPAATWGGVKFGTRLVDARAIHVDASVYEPNRRLRGVVEMELPGRLEFEEHERGAIVHPSAAFDPLGLAGLAYWYGIYPIHRRVFAGMLRGIASRAVTGSRERAPQPV